MSHDLAHCDSQYHIFNKYGEWLNKKHFEYRGLIEKGLALKALEDMYNTKTEQS